MKEKRVMRIFMKQSLLSCTLLLSCGGLWGMEAPTNSLKSIAERFVKESGLDVKPLIAEYIMLEEKRHDPLVRNYQRAKSAFKEYIEARRAILSDGRTIIVNEKKFFACLEEPSGVSLDDYYRIMISAFETYKAIKPDWKKIKKLEKNFERSTGLNVLDLLNVTELTPQKYASALQNCTVNLLGEKILEEMKPLITAIQNEKIEEKFGSEK